MSTALTTPLAALGQLLASTCLPIPAAPDTTLPWGEDVLRLDDPPAPPARPSLARPYIALTLNTELTTARPVLDKEIAA